jgi:hypothetical protein
MARWQRLHSRYEVTLRHGTTGRNNTPHDEERSQHRNVACSRCGGTTAFVLVPREDVGETAHRAPRASTFAMRRAQVARHYELGQPCLAGAEFRPAGGEDQDRDRGGRELRPDPVER